ncbi:MAG: amidase [Parvibaculaceae bacterium]
MGYSPPSRAELAAIAGKLGLDVDDRYLSDIEPILATMADAFRTLDGVEYDRPSLYPRYDVRTPSRSENELGAWSVRMRLEGRPDGRLAGRRVALKDNISLAGVPMSMGTSALKDYCPDSDASIVTRLLDAGADIAGKAVCEYLAFSGSNITAASGPVENPRNPGFSTGGSSSGSAALVASGEVELGVGTDQAGSVRVPASFSGLCGMKPTFGLVPYTGILGIDATIDHVGLLTKRAAQNAEWLEVLAGPDNLDHRYSGPMRVSSAHAIGKDIAGLRIGVLDEGFAHANTEPDVDKLVRKAVARLAELGTRPQRISIPWHRTASAIWSSIALEGAFHGLTSGHGAPSGSEHQVPLTLMDAVDKLMAHADDFADTLKVSLIMGGYAADRYRGRYYAKARNLRPRLKAAYDDALSQVDLLIMPTTPMKATRMPSRDAPVSERLTHCWEMNANTCPFNLTGHPALSIPCGASDGRPVGMMLVGRHFDEALLYQVAHAFETSHEG